MAHMIMMDILRAVSQDKPKVIMKEGGVTGHLLLSQNCWAGPETNTS